ncbi:MAG: PAS domain S-box protein [Candidatus Lokiarchaeota archaeon]|nr:PAS domain S-box protein [Candidatus Lokiarchaeota archaeon]MBD3201660.1 PAS domain S-box protein [Candidatus Lokiarchaeota archaeon]
MDEVIHFIEMSLMKKIRKSEKNYDRYKHISENITDLVGILNKSFEYEFVNESPVYNLLGYQKEDLIFKTVLDFIHQDDINSAISNLKKGFEKGSGSAEIRFKHKNSKWIWLDVKGKMFFDKDGEKKALLVSRDITERKKTEEKANLLSSITQQVKDSIILTDLNFKITYINKATEELYGYEKEELLGKTPEFLNAEPLADEIQNDIYQTILSKKVWKGAHLNKKKNGHTFICDLKISPLLDEYGNIIAFISIQRDISEIRDTQQLLVESEEKFQMLAEQAIVGIFIIQDYVYKYVNEKFCDLSGYSADKLMNWKPYEFFKLIHPDYVEFTKEQAMKKLKGKSDVTNHYQYKAIKKTGDIAWVEQYSSKINYQGKEAILGFILEITDRKKTEAELKESEQKFRKMSEQSLSGIAILQNDKFVYLNKSFAKIVGYPVEELINWNLNDYLQIIHPDDREKVKEQALKKQKGIEEVINHYEYRIVNKDGQITWINNNSGTIIYKGQTADLINTIDITERKRMEEELIKISNMKSELLNRISHELKTPITTINGYLELLTEEYEDLTNNPTLDLIIPNLISGTEKLNTLINNIIKTVSLDSENIELNKVRANLGELILSCLEELNPFLYLRKHNLKVNIDNSLIIEVDAVQIKEVIVHLLINAFKFTPPNGNIEIYTKDGENMISVYVKDDGIGLKQEEIDYLFTEFGKIELYGKGYDIMIEGSGLGLHICKKIINLHDGLINVKSEGRNKGSIFYFKLPKN